MQKLISWLENSFAPKMNKISNMIWIVTIKDSVLQILPFIFLGSIFCCLAIIEDYVTLPFSFWTPFGWTMGKVSLLISFLIPFNYCEKKRFRKQRLIAGLSGLILFLIVVTPIVEAEGSVGFGSSALGAGGMFCAMITGVITGLIMGVFAKFTFFKEDSVIPDFVRQWFDALLPIGIVVVLGWVVVLVMNVNLYNIVLSIFMPLQSFLQTWYGFTFFMLLTCFIYSMGISSWVLTPVTQPVILAAIVANGCSRYRYSGKHEYLYKGPCFLYIYVGRRYRLYIAFGRTVGTFQIQRAESARKSLPCAGNLQYQ